MTRTCCWGLLLYAYAVGERSSRRIERLCSDHVAFGVLCAQDPPDHTTIARFRAEHQDLIADLFAQVLRLCSDAGMVKVGVVSIDGTKIKANASRSANRSADWVRDKASQIAGEIVADAARVDAAEDAATADPGSDSDLPPSFATRKARAENIKKALDELERQHSDHAVADGADQARGEEFVTRAATRASSGRPPAGVDLVAYHQARIGRLQRLLDELAGPGRENTVIGQRAQSRRSLKHAEQALTRAQAQAAAGKQDLRGAAARERDRQAKRAKSRGAVPDSVNITDPESRLMIEGSGGGSVQGYNAQLAVTDDHYILGIHLSQDANDTACFTPTLHAATTQATGLGKEIGLVLADAGYFTKENLTAPGPDRLIAPGKNRHLRTEAEDHRAQGLPPPDLNPMDAMRHRLRQPGNAQAYKRRSATVETVIGHIKDQAGLRTFARRGLQAVAAELHLAATVVNLNRLPNAHREHRHHRHSVSGSGMGRRVDENAYPDSTTETESLAWHRASREKILQAIAETWPDIPTPEEVTREDGEVLGRIVPTSGGWQATTAFGAALGEVTTHDDAIETLEDRGLSSLAEPWQVRVGDTGWREALLLEVTPRRVRIRWTDPMVDQPPSGQWFEVDDIDLLPPPQPNG